MTDTTLAQRREQLIDVMKDAAKGETKATLRAEIARLTAANKALTEELNGKLWHWQKRATAAEAKLAKVEAERDDLQNRYNSLDHNIDDARDLVSRLSAELEEARKHLHVMTDKYVAVAGNQNDGFWNADAEPSVVGARSFLASKDASHAD